LVAALEHRLKHGAETCFGVSMGFFDRITNVWRGFLSLWVSNVETRNPEAVYEAAIEERIRQHRDLKKAVSSIVYLRNKTETELAERQKELIEVNLQLPIAIEEGEDDVALILIQQKDELAAKVAGLQGELEKIASEAEEAKISLISYQGEILKNIQYTLNVTYAGFSYHQLIPSQQPQFLQTV
jgi:phage shock protein A